MEKYAKYKVSGPESSGGNKWEKYKVSPNLGQQGDSWATLIPKSVASGVASLADTPQTLASLAREYILPEIKTDSPVPTPDLSEPPLFSGLLKEAGLEPRPSTPEQRIASKAAEFAGSFGPFGLMGKGAQGLNLLQRFNKGAKAGAGIGATSGLLQEGGVNPLVADLTAGVGMPLAGASSKNLLNKFSKAHKTAKAEQILSNAFKKQIGEENLPEVLNKIKNYSFQRKPIDVQLTTPEVAQDVGLSRLYSSTQSNSPKIVNAHQENNRKLLESLEGIGTTGLPESVKGEAVRSPFFEKFNKKVESRARLTKPLYEQLEALQEGLEPVNTKALLEKEISVSSPGNKAPLEKYLKGLARNEANPEVIAKIKQNEAALKNIDLEYQQLSPDARAQLKAPIEAELEQLKSSIFPRPIQIENTIQELGDKVNAFSRTGETNAARKYGGIKKALEEDLSTNPLGLKHRDEYRRLSKPVNEIETSSLLNNFVKKNKDVSKLEGFVAPSEKIPKLILDADLPNTKILVNKAKGNKELLDLVKGTYIDKLLEVSKIGGEKLSYDKANKFINNKYNHEKLKAIFNKEELKKIDQYLDVLKRRNNVDTMGKFSGSDTHQKFKIEDEFNNSLNSLSKLAGKGFAKLTGTGKIGSTIVDKGLSFIPGVNRLGSTEISNALLEDAFVNPNVFKRLMTTPARPKTFGDFYNPVPPLSLAARLGQREE